MAISVTVPRPVPWHDQAMEMNTRPSRKIGGTTVMAGTVPPLIERTTPGPGQESVWDYPRPTVFTLG